MGFLWKTRAVQSMALPDAWPFPWYFRPRNSKASVSSTPVKNSVLKEWTFLRQLFYSCAESLHQLNCLWMTSCVL